MTILRNTAATWPKSSSDWLDDSAHGGELADRLAVLFMTRTIAACAILEGAAFFLLIAYLLEGTLILVMGRHFTTRSALVHWIENQARRIDEERQLAI